MMVHMFFFFNDTATTEIYTLPTRRSSDLASAGSGNLCPLDGLGSADDLAEPGIGDVPVPPGDVAADHAGLLAMGLVVGAVEGEIPQGGELGLDPVEPGSVEGDVGQLRSEEH